MDPEPKSKGELIREELLAEAKAIKQQVYDSWIHDVYLFNTECLLVEDGKNKVHLSSFHKEICKFVDSNPTRQKLLLVPRGHLKALKIEGTKILTSYGFKPYKDLKVGDLVIGEDGNSVRIKTVHPKEKMELYKVVTNDGRELICNDEHLFKVRISANDKKWKIRNLKWIKNRYKKERLDKRNNKIYYEHPIQLNPIFVNFAKKDFPIDPYTLGLWLGDGHSSGSRLTTADPEIFNYSEFVWHKVSGKYNYDTHGLQKKLRLMNLKKNKHIPQEYLLSDYEQRIKLLRGLMDTDGTCHSQGGIAYFSNTNYSLISGLVELVRSLGGVAVICKVNQQVNGLPYDAWTVSVKLPKNINPFKLKRKANKFNGLKRELTINIVSVEKVEDDIANCITLEDENGMFIVNDYFPTHNSTLITIGKTIQWICEDPTVRILIANATYQMAITFLNVVKRHLTNNPNLIEMFGPLAENPDKWAENLITLNQARVVGGEKEATVCCYGMGGNLVSQHYDKIILDDVVNDDTVNTKEQIEKTIQFYRLCQPLLEKNGEMIIIGTRWREDDLYGWIIDRENGVIQDFDIYERQAIKNELWDDHKKEFVNGTVLWPEKYNLKDLSEIRRKMGPWTFSAQYQNNPVPPEDADFKKEWFRYYEPTDLRGYDLNKYTLIDPAISLEKGADYTAMITVAIDVYGNIYILDIVRERLNVSGIINEIFHQFERWHPQAIGLEEVAFQRALRYSLTKEMEERKRYLNIVELKPHTRTKDQRVKGLQPLYANGKVLHLKDLVYNIYLEDELLRFPKGKHDDMIDALSYALDLIHPPQKKVERYRKQKYLYGH